MPRILVVRSANVDFTIAAPRLPAPGETVRHVCRLGRKPVDLLLSPPERFGNRHLELLRDSRGLKSTWEISEE